MSTLKTNTIDVYSGSLLTVTPDISFAGSVTAATFSGALNGNSTGCSGTAVTISTVATTAVQGKVLLETAHSSSTTSALTPSGLKTVVDAIGVGGILTYSKLPTKVGTLTAKLPYTHTLTSNAWSFANIPIWVHDKSYIQLTNSGTGYTPTQLPAYGNNPAASAAVSAYPRACEYAQCIFLNNTTSSISFLVSNLSTQMFNTADVVVPNGRLFRVTYMGGWTTYTDASGIVGELTSSIKQYYIELLPA